jgi:phage/plasmid-associated DNA primase
VGRARLPRLARAGPRRARRGAAATDVLPRRDGRVGGFLDEALRRRPGHGAVTAKELYEAYTSWCEANGERARSQKALASGLRERGFEAAKGTKGVRVWRGLRLRREDEALGGGWRMGGASSGNLSHSRVTVGCVA